MVNYMKSDPNHPLNELTALSGAFTGLIPNVGFSTSHWIKSEVTGLDGACIPAPVWWEIKTTGKTARLLDVQLEKSLPDTFWNLGLHQLQQ